MKKLMVAFVAIAAFVSVASAEDAWFNGGLGDGSLSGGSWTEPLPGGVTKPSSSYVLEDVESKSPLSFTATTAKAADSTQNLNFATSAKFAYSYDELPEVDSGAKAGVVVHNDEYYVLEKDAVGGTNKWASTGIPAVLIEPVNVAVTITNGTDGAHALYQFGNSTAIDRLVVASGDWGAVDYSGCGEVASLVGTTILLDAGYPIPGPGNKTIVKSIADPWAEANDIPSDKIAEVLASNTEFNGRTAAESCLLGVATNADLKATVVDEDAAELGFDLDCTPVSGRALIKVKRYGAVVESGVEVQDNEVSLAIADGIYQVVAEVDGANKQIPVSQEVGVKGTEVAATKVAFIGAPWADCSIADLFKKTCCAEGDKVEVYDAEGDSYKSWRFNGTAWEFVDGQGDEPSSIKKGQAVKYTPAAAGTLYQIGDVSTVNTTQVGLNKWNLIACPDGEIASSDLPLANDNDQAIVLGDDGVLATAVFQKFGKNGLYKKAGYNAGWEKVTDADKVECGFFLRPTKNDSVTWPAKAQ